MIKRLMFLTCLISAPSAHADGELGTIAAGVGFGVISSKIIQTQPVLVAIPAGILAIMAEFVVSAAITDYALKSNGITGKEPQTNAFLKNLQLAYASTAVTSLIIILFEQRKKSDEEQLVIKL